MFSIIGFILLFILFIVVFGVAIIATVVRSLFGRNKRNSYTQNTYHQQQSGDRIDGQPKRKKYFDDEEGEYVDFEEIKE